MINNYTTVGLTVLFLLVVASLLIFGIITGIQGFRNPQRTDKETPYVPIPEGGVKLSTAH